MNYREVASHANAMNEKSGINEIIDVRAWTLNTIIKKCLLTHVIVGS